VHHGGKARKQRRSGLSCEGGPPQVTGSYCWRGPRSQHQ
jgi:hypothetical protein